MPQVVCGSQRTAVGSLLHVGPMDQTQVVGLGGKHLYPLNHLVNSECRWTFSFPPVSSYITNTETQYYL